MRRGLVFLAILLVTAVADAGPKPRRCRRACAVAMGPCSDGYPVRRCRRALAVVRACDRVRPGFCLLTTSSSSTTTTTTLPTTLCNAVIGGPYVLNLICDSTGTCDCMSDLDVPVSGRLVLTDPTRDGALTGHLSDLTNLKLPDGVSIELTGQSTCSGIAYFFSLAGERCDAAGCCVSADLERDSGFFSVRVSAVGCAEACTANGLYGAVRREP